MVVPSGVPAGARRPGSRAAARDRGAVSVEAAFGILALLVVVTALVWCLSVLVAQLAIGEAARAAARVAARGDDVAAIQQEARRLVGDADVVVRVDADHVVVEVSRSVVPPGALARWGSGAAARRRDRARRAGTVMGHARGGDRRRSVARRRTDNRRPVDDTGAALVSALLLTSLLVVVALLGGGVADLLAARQRAAAAADLGALAAAPAASTSEAAACASAAWVVRDNGATLRSCSVVDGDVRLSASAPPVPPGRAGWRACSPARSSRSCRRTPGCGERLHLVPSGVRPPPCGCRGDQLAPALR